MHVFLSEGSHWERGGLQSQASLWGENPVFMQDSDTPEGSTMVSLIPRRGQESPLNSLDLGVLEKIPLASSEGHGKSLLIPQDTVKSALYPEGEGLSHLGGQEPALAEEAQQQVLVSVITACCFGTLDRPPPLQGSVFLSLQ